MAVGVFARCNGLLAVVFVNLCVHCMELVVAIRQGPSPYEQCSLFHSVGATSSNPRLMSSPSQVRLSVTKRPGELRLSWVSPAKLIGMSVTFGLHRKSMNDVIEESEIRFTRYILPKYRREVTNGRLVRGKRSPYIYHTTLWSLLPSTRYFYQIHAEGDTGMQNFPTKSRVFSFTSPPAVSGSTDGAMDTGDTQDHGQGYKDAAGSVHFLFLADHGTKPNSYITTDALVTYARKKGDVDLLLHGGDMSYGNGKDYLWDAWGAMIEPLSSRYPYMVVAGNHELVPGDSGKENGSPLLHRFQMPYPHRHHLTAGSTFKGNAFWYSFDWGPVHFIAISTEHDDDPLQTEWVESDLQAARSNPGVEWIVTFGHAPIYTSNIRHGNKTVVRSWLAPLLDKWKVDLSLWGHDHSYERLYPLWDDMVTAKDYISPDGTVHVICGSAGWDLHDCWSATDMSAFHNADTWGFLSIKAANSSMLTVEFINSSDLSVVDSLVLQKGKRKQKPPPASTQNLKHSTDAAASTVTSPLSVSSSEEPTECPTSINSSTTTSSIEQSTSTLGHTSSTTLPSTSTPMKLSSSSETPSPIDANDTSNMSSWSSSTVSVNVSSTSANSSDAGKPGNHTNSYASGLYHRLVRLAWAVGGGILVFVIFIIIRHWCCPSGTTKEEIALSVSKQGLLEASDYSDSEDST